MFQRIRAPSAMAGKPDGARYLADPDALERLAERCRGGEEDVRLSDEFSLVLHDIRMAGAWKRTNRGRLREAEEMLATHTAPALRDDPLLHDLGASDGITTLDAVRFLTERFGKPVPAVLTDLNLWLLRFRRGPVVEYRASNGEPIMMRLGCYGLRLAEQRKHLEHGRDPLASLYLRCGDFRAAMRLETRLSLVNPLVHANPGIEIRELDC